MPKPAAPDLKLSALRQAGTLNPHPEEVTDTFFLDGDFFDSRDMVQVKYEMLRRVQREGLPVLTAAAAFGFSRPAYYQVQKHFAGEGLAGLLPRQRGPKKAHKLTGPVMEFISRVMSENPPVRAETLAEKVREQFGFSVHPRSIERAIARQKKRQP